jgi:hypothetical protein
MKTTLRAAYEKVVQKLVQLQQEAQTPEVKNAITILDGFAGSLRSRMVGGEPDGTPYDDGEPELVKVVAKSEKLAKPKKTNGEKTAAKKRRK